MSDLDRAVDAELQAFRPVLTPPFAVVLDRRREARRRRTGLVVAAGAVTTLLVVPVAWWAASGGDRLVQEAGPATGGPQAAFSVHQVLDAAPQDAATGSITAPASDAAGAFPGDYACGSPATGAVRPDLGGGLVVCTPEGLGPSEVLRVAPAALTSSAVAAARVDSLTPDGGSWQLVVDLTSDGSRAYEELTGEAACADLDSPGRRLALVVDGSVLGVPSLSPDVSCGDGIRAGSVALILPKVAEAQAQDLARRLTPGAG